MNTKIPLRLFLVPIMVAVFPLLTSCSTVIPPGNLVPASYDVRNRHSASVLVEVDTAKVEALTYWHFTGQGFADALAQALRESGVFQSATTTGNGTYHLKGSISVEYDPAGINLSTKTRSQWSLVRTVDGKEVWSDLIGSSHTATFGDAFSGAKRGRLATEGAAKKCIQQVVSSLSNAKF